MQTISDRAEDKFYEYVCLNDIPVYVFMASGRRLTGNIKVVDDYSFILVSDQVIDNCKSDINLVYKNCVATIQPLNTLWTAIEKIFP